LLEPIGLVWACLLVLTVALWRKGRRYAWATLLLAALLYVFGSTGLPGWLVQRLERPYAGVKIAALPRADAIVVLGGGAEPSRHEAGGLHLTFAGDRLLMALELSRAGKAPVVVLGGAFVTLDGVEHDESELVRRYLTERSLARGEIVALPRCEDTHDEALRIRTLFHDRGWSRVLLVTSANHMRRAEATFRAAGVAVTPAPCNFLSQVSLGESPGGFSVPRAGGFMKFGVWLHEQVGWWMYSWRGWL
jgi:uncharacterized SAM-binding protein YcdF (DUF218 family)